MKNKIKSKTLYIENLQAPLFEELSDSEISKIVGGFQVAFTSTPTPVQPPSSRFLEIIIEVDSVDSDKLDSELLF